MPMADPQSEPALSGQEPVPGPDPSNGPGSAGVSAGSCGEQITNQELIRALQADRLWLLRQLDSGAWPEWRLDLAALERELGELLDRVAEAVD